MSGSAGSFIQSARPEFETTLRDWVRIPTVSALPEYKSDISSGADHIAAALTDFGADVSVVQTAGNPVVTASLTTHPSHRTVLIYNHMDVQPANEPEWTSDPFDMRIDGDTYRGRGTTDDKGPALTALFAARHAIAAGVPINIKFVWEFEEEIGSPNFESFVALNTDRLRADSVVVSDTIWVSRLRPAIPFGLRGLLSARLLLETGTKDVHSGLTGGAARNPITELCAVLAACYEVKTGSIRIPGFYNGVQPVDPSELEGFMDSGFSANEFQRAHALKRIRSEDSGELMRRIWSEPTFEVHGIVGGYQGSGVKTAIPPRAEAKVSMRLVPDQSPAEIFELFRDFVGELNPDIQVVMDSTLSPYIGPRTGPYATAASEAVKAAFGVAPAGVREGGSIGAVITMHDYLKIPIIFLGLSLPEHGYHAPNEHFDWGQAAGGIRMFLHYFEKIATL